jgi:hypothetical protein
MLRGTTSWRTLDAHLSGLDGNGTFRTFAQSSAPFVQYRLLFQRGTKRRHRDLHLARALERPGCVTKDATPSHTVQRRPGLAMRRKKDVQPNWLGRNTE